MLARTTGDTLCFLPGAAEIARSIGEMRARLPEAIDLVPLHGALDSAEQEGALRPSPGRRPIDVATNIAETSVTVPGVTAVIDSGLQKVARYDGARGIDSLDTERVTQDAADQRAGRAGRISAGFVCRLWDASLRLRKHREPDIARIDLAGPCLDILAWGASPLAFDWFERPHQDALEAAMALLRRLGAVQGDGLTALGHRLHRLPVHPRLARMLVDSGGAQAVVRACALLSERHYLPSARASSASDLLSAVDAWHEVPAHIKRIASDIEARAAGASAGARTPEAMVEAEFLRAVLAGYPDRVAQRRAPGSARLKLASGGGAVLAAESGVRAGEFLVAIDARRRDVRGHRSGTTADDETVVRMASIVERDWLVANRRETVHRYDESVSSVRASVLESFDALTLRETPVQPDPAIAAGLLAEAWRRRESPADIQLLRRIRFAGLTFDAEAAVRTAAYGVVRLDDVDLRVALTADQIRTMDRDAPERLTLPSGRSTAIEYAGDGSIGASAKLQELFGLAETPRIGPSRMPLVLTLLAPNGRPVQVTQDLRSFWNRTYPEVRKELRGRYPKHPWPDDPWTATPTAKTTRRSGPTRS
jgi:ATP-dependent helicase HrpB